MRKKTEAFQIRNAIFVAASDTRRRNVVLAFQVRQGAGLSDKARCNKTGRRRLLNPTMDKEDAFLFLATKCVIKCERSDKWFKIKLTHR